jgi:sugar phosphate isomerase/epimerase
MLGPEDLVLCCGTVAQANFRELVEAASAGGYKGMALWPQLYDAARESGLSVADLRRMLDDNGLEIAEHDALLNWLPGGPSPESLGDGLGSSLFSRTAEDFFRIADALGGRSLNVAQVFGSELDLDVAAEALAPVCEGAANSGLLVSLEFLPWTGIPDPKTALAIVERTGHANAGLMVDSWHVFRGVGDIEALRTLPGERVVGVQLNDAPTTPAPDPAVETMEARLIPGEGDIDLPDFVRVLDAIGSRAPIGVEVYSSKLAAQPPNEVASRCAEATRAVLAQARR